MKFGNIIVIVVAVIIIGVVFGTMLPQGGQKVPNVKFTDFSATTPQSIKQGGQFAITFKVIDNGQYPVNATVQTTFNGTSQYFSIDKPTIQISPPIGGNFGTSGMQTITIMGNNLGGLSSVSQSFTVVLYVNSIKTDTRQFDVSLTQ